MVPDDLHSTIQEVLARECKGTKSLNLSLHTPHEVRERKIEDSGMKKVSEAIFKNVKMKNLKFKSEIADKIDFAEKRHKTMKVTRSREINCSDASSSLLKLAKIEESNDDDK